MARPSQVRESEIEAKLTLKPNLSDRQRKHYESVDRKLWAEMGEMQQQLQVSHQSTFLQPTIPTTLVATAQSHASYSLRLLLATSDLLCACVATPAGHPSGAAAHDRPCLCLLQVGES